jgi:hypothetical protein
VVAGSAIALRLVVAGVAAAYVLYLLSRSEDRAGRIAVFACWLGAAGASALVPGVVLFVMVHVLLIWLVRALYFHAGVLAALADLGLSLLALSAAVWAGETGSLFVCLWTFFLVSALFVVVPTTWAAPDPSLPVDDDGFHDAQRTAESALRRIATRRN